MALKANRAGVRTDQVDTFGRVVSKSFLRTILDWLPRWTDLNVWKNGTEQLLPENTSTPTTTPILIDIDYPEVERDNQYFTYRESPTTVDGLAKIKSIKGNTIVWNQLVLNGNFASTSNWSAYLGTMSANNNVLTFTSNSNNGYNSITQTKTLTSGHKYLAIVDIDVNGVTTNVHIRHPFSSSYISATGRKIYSWVGDYADNDFAIQFNPLPNGSVIYIRNAMLIDLTLLNDSRITDYNSFQEYYGGVSYYEYNSGSLLSFNGNGIKTTGKNLLDPNQIEYGMNWNGNAVNTRAVCFLKLPYGQYTFSIQSIGTLAEVSVAVVEEKYGERFSLGGLTNIAKSRTVTVDANRPYAQFLLRINSGTITQADFESCQLMIESGSSATSYEPYTSSTTSLPISEYFPTGLKSAGNVYDELLPNKAIIRIGAVDLGTLTWEKNTNYDTVRFIASISGAKLPVNNQTIANIASIYPTDSVSSLIYSGVDGVALSYNSFISVRVNAYNDYSVSQFKTAMSGVYLFYELATPVVQSTMTFE